LISLVGWLLYILRCTADSRCYFKATVMARTARSEVFDNKETNCIFTECTAAPGRQLAGLRSPFSSGCDERRVFIEEVLAVFRQYFAVELITYTFDGRRIQQMLLPKPQLAAELSPEDVARRWLIICPSLRRYEAPLHQPSEMDICRLLEDADRIDRIRGQLSDVAWWNRLLCQRIAQNFNKRDNLRGRFWEGRFHSTLLLDELSRISCRTSIDTANGSRDTAAAIAVCDSEKSGRPQNEAAFDSVTQMPPKDYLTLLEMTCQAITQTPADTQLINTLDRLLSRQGISASVWLSLVMNFSYNFSQIAGRLENMDRHVSRISRRRFFVRPHTRKLLRQQPRNQHVCENSSMVTSTV
jgi:hypothetical protein